MTKWTNEQLEAINKSGSNIIVSAGAGSGKTAVLTERVIAKLKDNTHINELLILTFTNNAAAEMKQRIKKAIVDNPELNGELSLIESAYITTFDAYVLSLVKKYHYILNLDQDLNIISETIIKEKKKEIIDTLFNEYYLKEDNNFINLVTNYGVKNDHNIKNKILELDSKLDLKINKEEYLNNYLNSYYSKDNINLLFNEYLNVINIRIASIKNALNNLANYIDNTYLDKVYPLLDKLFKADSYENIRSNLDITLPRLPNNSAEEAKYYKGEISDLLKDLKEYTIYQKELLINDLLKTKNDAEIIINILIKLNEEIKNYKLKHNMFEFTDISKFGLILVSEHPDVQKEIKNYFKEIMIDEYQDTNDLEEAFISLIQNNNVYMVGDIKQSIYRFRNANPDIFKVKYDFYKANNGGIKIDLNKNFRSRSEVLDGINIIFNHIMDNDIGNANYKLEHNLIFGNNDYNLYKPKQNNNLEIYDYVKDDLHSKEEIEAFIIGNDIIKRLNHDEVMDHESLRKCSYKDFCILMDRTTTFDIYKKVFDYLKIPLNIYKDEDISISDEIYLINNILSMIIDLKLNKQDLIKFYYTSIARSYLYALDDNIIYNTIKNNKIKESDIYQKCISIANKIDSLSNEEVINLIIDEFKFYEKMISVGNVNYRNIIINNLLDNAREINAIGTDIYGMKNYLNNLLENKEPIKLSAIISDSDSVTITNIHKSKGLEYKICYFSGFTKEFNMQDLKDKILYSNTYGLILPVYNEGFKSTFLNVINKEKEVKDEISERIRLLYVALTRAKEKIIIVTSLKEKAINTENTEHIIDELDRLNYRSFNDILSSCQNYLKDYIKEVDIPLIDEKYKFAKTIDYHNIKQSNEKVLVNEIDYSKNIINESHYSKESNHLVSEEDISNMNYGTKMHYLLETYDFNNPNQNNYNEDEKRIINNLIKSNLFIDYKKAKIYKEYEFIYQDEANLKTGIIDLMLEYNDHIIIIDYKLKHIDDEAYIKQLNGYKDFIIKKTRKKVNCYLYSLTDGIIKEIY